MKKFLAIIITICMLSSMLAVTAVPTSAAGGFIILCGISRDGLEWALGIYDNFEEAWNDTVYYSTHLEEAWNSSTRYETEEERPAEEGFVRVIVTFYDDWNADSNGSFGSGIGFKDGALYVPDDAKITLDMGGHTINRGEASGKAMFIDAGADIAIRNGNVIGDIHADKKANVTVSNVYVAGNTSGSSRSVYSASIFGESSVTMGVAILALLSSAVAICLSVANNKKKSAYPEKTKDE